MLSEHYALPFGGVGSVYGWDRVGSCIFLTSLFCSHFACFIGHMLRSLARRLLKIPVLRYVDDYFGADRLQCAAGALIGRA